MRKMISIIVPIYKVEPFLERCIDSILNQTYKDLQIILVDDGSPDGCGAICDEYRERDERICVVHKCNGGVSSARNAGLGLVKGEYIGFVDGDDYIHPQMYEILKRNLEETSSDISMCSFQYIENGQQTRALEENIRHVFEGESILEQLIDNNMETVVLWNKLYKKSIFDDLHFETVRCHEDEYIIHRVLSKIQRMAYSELKLYYYVRWDGSLTNNRNMKSVKEAWDSLEDRCVFLKGMNDRLYCSTRWQQLDMLIKYYFQICREEDRKDKLSTRLLKQSRVIAKERMIWAYFSWRFRIHLLIFLVSPHAYHWITTIVRRIKTED